jgi:hypothetical protein
MLTAPLMQAAQSGVAFDLWPRVDAATQERLIAIAKASPQQYRPRKVLPRFLDHQVIFQE